jgi:hypothetical protein
MEKKIEPNKVPTAYSMLAMADRIRPRRDGQHVFQHYLLLWAAFEDMAGLIARRSGYVVKLKKTADGEIITVRNGNVNIPQVERVDEKQKIILVLQDLTADQKDMLIMHPSTDFLEKRIPRWQGMEIERDAFGQKLNGVLSLRDTCDACYPVWSPIDSSAYHAYMVDQSQQDLQTLLAGQILNDLQTLRGNILQRGRKLDDGNDLLLVERNLELIKQVIGFFKGW